MQATKFTKTDDREGNMKRWGVMLATVAMAACAKEKKESPAISADTTHVVADTTMMRDTARTPARE